MRIWPSRPMGPGRRGHHGRRRHRRGARVGRFTRLVPGVPFLMRLESPLGCPIFIHEAPVANRVSLAPVRRCANWPHGPCASLLPPVSMADRFPDFHTGNTCTRYLLHCCARLCRCTPPLYPRRQAPTISAAPRLTTTKPRLPMIAILITAPVTSPASACLRTHRRQCHHR